MADKTDRDNVIILRGQVAMLQAQIEAMARNVSETRQLYNQAQSELKALKARTMTDRDAADGYAVMAEDERGWG